MWLETLTLQTHQSSKSAIEQIFRETREDKRLVHIDVSVFYHSSSTLYVTWHLQHFTQITAECSLQAASLMLLLQRFGPVYHRAWLPFDF